MNTPQDPHAAAANYAEAKVAAANVILQVDDLTNRLQAAALMFSEMASAINAVENSLQNEGDSSIFDMARHALLRAGWIAEEGMRITERKACIGVRGDARDWLLERETVEALRKLKEAK